MVQFSLNNKDSSLLIEEVSFSDAELLEMVDLSKAEELEFIKFNNSRRKKEWLAVRHLLRKLCKDNIHIKYNENGKPFLSNNKNISISHSGNFIGIIISNKRNIGLDIEKVSKKLEKIKHKFITEHEENLIIKSSNKLDTLTSFWCAKEAMYKIYSKKELIFNENLLIKNIDETNKKIFAEIKTATSQDIELHYKKIKDYIIVWAF